MALRIEDRLKHALLPGWLYYSYKVAKEAHATEPELAVLRDIAPAGRLAVDVGTNRGYYSYALSRIASRVEAFEPNPIMAAFARRKLGAKVRLHEVALSNRSGPATLYIPQLRPGIDAHGNATLRKEIIVRESRAITVVSKTLDEYAFDDVGFIKIDVEGTEMDVIAGGAKTIARHRPNMLVELNVFVHDPLACVRHVTQTFRYRARILVDGRFVDAEQALAHPPPKWASLNILFVGE